MGKRTALVTNVLDFVGPPAVRALLADGYDVVAQDPAFRDIDKQKEYKAATRGKSFGHQGPEGADSARLGPPQEG